MIYIYEDGRVIYDGSTISEEERNKAIVVANKPIEENFEGKVAILKWNIEEQTAWYEYEDIPKSEEEKSIEKLRTDMNESIMELTMLIATMGGM